MNRLPIRRILLVLGVAALLWNLSCKSDDIPVTPGGPFLYTEMMLTSTTTPTPRTSMTKGQQYTARFSVAYALDPAMVALMQKGSLALYADIYTDNTNGSFTVLATTAERKLTATDGVISDSMKFTVPNTALYVNVEAYLDTIPYTNPVYKLDSQYWNVK
jgi:hypothetical protein